MQCLINIQGLNPVSWRMNKKGQQCLLSAETVVLGSLVALFHVSPAWWGICQSLPANSDGLKQMRILSFYHLFPAGVSVAGWKKPSPY